jgi:hypothetical protein
MLFVILEMRAPYSSVKFFFTLQESCTKKSMFQSWKLPFSDLVPAVTWLGRAVSVSAKTLPVDPFPHCE